MNCLLQKSRASFREEVERAILLGVRLPGRTSGPARAALVKPTEFARAATFIKFAVRRLIWKAANSSENTAGQGQCIGHRFEHLRQIMETCPKIPIGVCVDTAHALLRVTTSARKTAYKLWLKRYKAR